MLQVPYAGIWIILCGYNHPLYHKCIKPLIFYLHNLIAKSTTAECKNILHLCVYCYFKQCQSRSVKAEASGRLPWVGLTSHKTSFSSRKLLKISNRRVIATSSVVILLLTEGQTEATHWEVGLDETHQTEIKDKREAHKGGVTKTLETREGENTNAGKNSSGQ